MAWSQPSVRGGGEVGESQRRSVADQMPRAGVRLLPATHQPDAASERLPCLPVLHMRHTIGAKNPPA